MTTEEEKINHETPAQGQDAAAAPVAAATAAAEEETGATEDAVVPAAPAEERRARLGELPVEWTQMGKSDGPEAPMNVIRYPSEVIEIPIDETEVMVVGTAGKKITRIGPQFYKECSPELKQLVLRSHLIKTMEGLEGFKHLELLELYDNMVDELKNLNDGEGGAPGMTLTNLDMSYNVIREMKPVEFCPNLQELYLANNKLKTMAGLKGLTKLRRIDLGANRIRFMDGDELSGLVNLEELWLGKNKIEKIEGLENLTKLRRLDVQANRLTDVEGLTSQSDTLEELYLSHNAITSEGATLATGLALGLTKLNVLDLSRNLLVSTAPLAHLSSLEELWISGNKIATFDDVQPLSALGDQGLETVYLEYNPVADEFEYRKKVHELIPCLKQIDANLIGGLAAHGMPPVVHNTGTMQSVEEEMRRLQEAALTRARVQSGQK